MLKKLFLMLVLGALMTSVSFAQNAAPVAATNEEVVTDSAAKTKPAHKAKTLKKKKKKHVAAKKESTIEKK